MCRCVAQLRICGAGMLCKRLYVDIWLRSRAAHLRICVAVLRMYGERWVLNIIRF